MKAFTLFGERSLTTIAGIFESDRAARRAANALHDASSRVDVRLIAPRDPDLSRKMEPDSGGIWRTALRSHLGLGVIFLLVGALAGLALIGTGWDGAELSPWFTVFFTSVIGGLGGLVLGGLVTLRPDRGMLIRRVREASQAGRWTVVAHPVGDREERVAREHLDRAGGVVFSSL